MPSTDVRSAAVRWLGKLAPGRVILAGNPPAEVRAEVLRHSDDPGLVDTLWQSVTDTDPFVAQAARQGLAQRGVVTADIDLDSLTPVQRLAALLVLRESGAPEADKALRKFLADPDGACVLRQFNGWAKSG